MKMFAKTAFTLSGLFALSWVWYSIASDYDYQALSGTYRISQPSESCVLRLSANGSFSEELTRPGGIQMVSGKWHRFGEAGVEFSAPFLIVSGQKPGPGGEIFGRFEKTLTIFPSLTLSAVEDGPRFRRSMSR